MNLRGEAIAVGEAKQVRFRLHLWRPFLLLVLLTAVCVPASAQTVRIGLVRCFRGVTEASFSVSSGVKLVDPSDSRTINSSEADNFITVKASETGLSVSGTTEAPSDALSQVEIVPTSPDGIITVKSSGRHTTRYRGVIEVRYKNKRLVLVNRLDIEEYLLGVVPGEMPSHFHPEALKAQAIAARTYATAIRDKHHKDGYGLCDDINCQIYLGVDGEKTAASQAVKDTAGMVLTYEGKPIDAQFSADCGGRTRDGSKPYLRSVADKVDENSAEFCSISKSHDWTTVIKSEKLATFLAAGPDGKTPTIKSVTIKDTDKSGRVASIEITTDIGPKTVSITELRKTLGTTVIKSSIFTITPAEDGTFMLKGKGWGHGVGLCQQGANGMASSPYCCTFDKILKHYYAGTEISQTGSPEQTATSNTRNRVTEIPTQSSMNPLDIEVPPSLDPVSQ